MKPTRMPSVFGVFVARRVLGDLQFRVSPEVCRRNLIPLAGILALVVLGGATPAGAQSVSFIARRDFVVGARPISVAVGDFNGDRMQDLATANRTSNNVSVLINNTPH